MALTKVSTDGVKDDAITSGKIPANAVGASELADNAVDTNAIANNAVTASKTSGVQTTINNNADNRLITGSGSANTLNAESNATFTGTKLNLGAYDGGTDVNLSLRNTNSAGYGAYISGGSSTNYILRLDDYQQNAMFRFNANGKLGIGTGTPIGQLHLYQTSNDPYMYIQRGSGDTAATIGGIYWRNSTNSLALIDVQSADINDGHMRFYTMSGGTISERMRIRAGGGLTFNGDTAAANALDDYEEGTFTPSFNMTNGGHSLTYSLQQGSYTKIGNVVSVEIYLSVTGVNANGSGYLRIGGLPFTKTARYGGLNISYLYGINNIEISHALVDVNTNQIYLYKVQPSSSNYHTTTISIAEAFTTSTQIMLNGIYLAA
tara:strand:- start:525 stop:1655 length:1131 start_codon:yes stop_codon:yes gene_type:complete